MNITFRQLRLFLALAETGSVSAAARVMHVTQPTASMQLREVTQAVGLPLYEVISRRVHLTEAGQALLVEREALKSQLDLCRHQVQALQDQLKKQDAPTASCALCPLSDRAEATYLNIVGALLEVMLGHTPSGTPYSRFTSQEAVISALIAHHGNLMGIAERTLQAKFAQARRKLRSAN